MKIPMVDLKRSYDEIGHEAEKAMLEVARKANYILGEDVSRFEKEFAAFCGADYAAGVASGTDALRLAISACQIRKGDEVITTPFTFIATSETISQTGGTPVFADIEDDTYNIDPADIEKRITPRTKAIICVHLYGHPADMKKIMEIAKRHQLVVIEDCAQSFTAKFKMNENWFYTGTIGDCGTFSFFPAKNLGAFGDGGLVLSKNSGIIEKIKVLRNHGSSRPYVYESEGFNSRLDTIQAAVLRIKLRFVEKWTERRNDIALKYNERLENLCGVPTVRKDCKHSFNYYTVRFDSKEKRDKVRKYLLENQIACQIYYPICLHLQKAYAGLNTPSLPRAEKAQDEVLSLPMFPEMSDAEIETVADRIKEALK